MSCFGHLFASFREKISFEISFDLFSEVSKEKEESLLLNSSFSKPDTPITSGKCSAEVPCEAVSTAQEWMCIQIFKPGLLSII